MFSRIALVAGLAASLTLIAQEPVQAADRGDVAAGVVIGAVAGAVLGSQVRPAPAYGYAPPPPPPPQVVYYQPAPVYYVPAPGYYRPAPPPPRYYRDYRHGYYHDHRGRW
jgi:hypothetical protein